MPKPEPIAFVPKWMRDQPDDDFDGAIAFGSIPDQAPRIVTRLVPKDHGAKLPARVLSKVITLKQNLALYAARDVVQGVQPGFSDLRQLPTPLTTFAQLSIDPAEPGSYVIPAWLDAPPLPTTGPRPATADAVARRFA